MDVLLGLLREVGITSQVDEAMTAAIERVMSKNAEVRAGGGLDTVPKQTSLSKVILILIS